MGKYPTTNIVYSGIEDKGGPTVIILDEKKNKWTIWKADYENKELDSEAYRSLKSFSVGETFGIEYNEKEDSFTPKDGPNAGKIINFIRRTIYKILPLVSHPATPTANSSAQQESSNGGANRGQYSESRDAFGRRLAVHGFVNGMLAAGATIETVVNDLPALLNLEDAIDKALSGELPDPNVDWAKLAEDTPF